MRQGKPGIPFTEILLRKVTENGERTSQRADANPCNGRFVDTSNSNEWKWLGLIALLVCLALGAAYWFLVRPSDEGTSSTADNAPPPSLLEQSDNTEDLFVDSKPPQPAVTTEVTPSEAADLERSYQQRDSNTEVVYVDSTTSTTKTTTDTVEVPDYENDSVENVLADVPAMPRITYTPGERIGHGRAGFRFRGDAYNGGIFFCSLNTRRFKSAERCSSPMIYENLANGRYLFRVWQANDYGKLSKPSWWLFYVDRSAPRAPQIYGGPSAVTNDTSPTFYFQVDGDNEARCSLNNKNYHKARICRNPIDGNDLREGKYVFRVWQVNPVGNHSRPARLDFRVDLTQPAAPRILSGPEPSIESGTVPVFEFKGESGASYRCTIDKEASYSKDVCVSPWSPTEAPESGIHTFRVWQIDKAGNKSAPASMQFQVESAPVPTAFSARRSMQSFGAVRDAQGYSPDSDGAEVDPQQTAEDSTITLDVLAAIELATPDDDSDQVAPVTGGGSDANIGFSTSADLRSNLAWAVETSLSSNQLQGGSTGTRGLIESLDLEGSSDSGERNADNDAQTYGTIYSQDVSWGDEAGSYTVRATHTASQTLP